MSRFWNAAMLSAVLIIPIAITPTMLRADDNKPSQRYHDKKHNDNHEWNNHEDQAYRMYNDQNHRKYNDFSRLKERDQQNYWAWRHNHSDSLLKIEIR